MEHAKGLLNWSQMQYLMGCCRKTFIPITENLQKPESANSEKVRERLYGYREKQKLYYDSNTKVKDNIQPGRFIYTVDGNQRNISGRQSFCVCM